MTRRRLAQFMTTVALFSAGASFPTHAVDSLVLALPGSYLTPTYGVPGAVAQVGGTLEFVNLDIGRHDVVSVSALAPIQCTSHDPEICPNGTPEWCLPPDPTKVWTPPNGGNDLPFSPGTCPMIWSRQIGVGSTTSVLGLEFMTSGQTYQYYCQLHPSMRGTLVAL